jgi:MFS family permease
MTELTHSRSMSGIVAGRSDSYARYALSMLLIVYTFNFIDRIILGILVPPIKAELHLTDTELGLLGGTAFAIFYTALGIPLGWLADRLNRVRIIAISLALWSIFSAATGMAHGFAQLFAARLGVGIGEAGGVAPAYSLISDYFPAPRRARALAIYSFGIPIGSAAGLLFGGLIASSINWRMAFLAVGALGFALAPIFAAAVREPTRGALDAWVPAQVKPRLATVIRLLAGKVSFWTLSLGGATCSIMGYGMFFWLPSFFVRSYHFSLPQVAWCLAALTLFGGIAGIWLGGWSADRLGARRRGAYAFVPAGAFVLTVPLYAIGVLAPPSLWILPLFLIPTALALAWLGPTICAIQHLVPPEMRAVASALFLFINNLIGLGIGTWLIGRLSDHFAAQFGAEALRYAILTGTSFYLISAGFFLIAAKRLARDWHQ